MEESQKKISVIVPFYNAEATIQCCIESILNQTYGFIEVLLINDESTDSSLSICQKYADEDSRIRIINASHCGVSAARNIGLEQMAGDYFCFVDADDCLDFSFCEKMLKRALEEQADLTFCKIFWIPSAESKDETCLEAIIKEQRWEKFLSGVRNWQMGTVWRILYDAKKFINIRFDERLYVCEDTIYLFDCLLLSLKQALCDEKLYHYKVPEHFYIKYYRDSFVEECLYLGFCLKTRLTALKLEDYADAELFKSYCLALSGICHDKEVFHKQVGKLKEKAALKKYNTKEHARKYKRLYPEASRIKIYLVKQRMFSLFRLIYNFRMKSR